MKRKTFAKEYNIKNSSSVGLINSVLSPSRLISAQALIELFATINLRKTQKVPSKIYHDQLFIYTIHILILKPFRRLYIYF